MKKKVREKSRECHNHKPQKSSRFIHFDFESTQETGEHHVNFCVAQRGCDICMDLQIDQPCPTCSQFSGGREMIFEGVDALANFCGWEMGDDNKGVTCIAYNFGGYDGQFILRHILENGTGKPNVIMNGNTILRMTIGKVLVLDSYQFLHMRIGSLPDTFGLTEMKKGYCPHLEKYWPTRDMLDLIFRPRLTTLDRCQRKIETSFSSGITLK